MKLFLILFLFLTGFCFAEDFICLVDKTTNKVSDITIDTPVNRVNWGVLAGTEKLVRYFSIDKIPDYKNKLWVGSTISNDNSADAQDLADKKDINKKVDELLICALLVLLDYQNGDIKTKTPSQFRADVIAKYNSRNT